MPDLDANLILATHEHTTLRQLAVAGRVILRRSGATAPRKALWADVAHPTNPNVSEGFEMTEAQYAAALELGIPERGSPGSD
jgi:hypothetical protein